ncbi:hypothetical protein GCM10010245_85910 [Streptomyces spectabilis]|uniref:Uncharacterized protein n=1 Tax=Streptomyces spectabilis TaxID=68270 RepID=A0A5P2XBN1_STRST|nr:hypothetical protein CP982_14930 [Streptomyces spectabilis]GGV54339.1 hypothetical protein GCM10010245_85910 [Streptomyces spectabilis]
MRDAIARTLSWVLALLPRARRAKPGRHTAKFLLRRRGSDRQPTPPLQPTPAPLRQPAPESASAAAWRTPWRAPSAETVRKIFEQRPDLPYLQRERWRAAAFAELGLDYDHPTTNITPVRRVTT